jgi:hypothetical protein
MWLSAVALCTRGLARKLIELRFDRDAIFSRWRVRLAWLKPAPFGKLENPSTRGN